MDSGFLTVVPRVQPPDQELMKKEEKEERGRRGKMIPCYTEGVIHNYLHKQICLSHKMDPG